MNINTGNIMSIFLHTSDVLDTITITTDAHAFIEYEYDDAPQVIKDYIHNNKADSVVLESEQYNGYLYRYNVKEV